MFFGLVFLWSRVWVGNSPTGNSKKRILVTYLAFGLILAVSTEYLQRYVPQRSFDYLDIVANVTGGTFGMILYVYLKRKQSILV